MDILRKILGIMICIVGLGIWYIDYLIFMAIGALTTWIATAAGITGMAVLGVQIVGWILTLGIMVLLLFAGIVCIGSGLGILSE